MHQRLKARKDNSGVITGKGDAASAAAYLSLITADYQRGHNGLVEAMAAVENLPVRPVRLAFI